MNELPLSFMSNSSDLRDCLDRIRPFFLAFILWSSGPFLLLSSYSFLLHHFSIRIQEQGGSVTPSPPIEISTETMKLSFKAAQGLKAASQLPLALLLLLIAKH